MAREKEPASAAVPDGGVRRVRQKRLRNLLLGFILLGLVASVACNVVLYRRALRDYRTISELQLDPYGLKHPAFPHQAAPAEGDEELPLVLFFGDSRAGDWPAPSASGWRFANRGNGGQTTEQVRGRFAAHVTPLSPRVVVVQAGINDLKAIPMLPGRRDEIVADCKANLRDLVRRSKAGGAVVIVTTIFPTGPVPLERRPVWSPEVERALAEMNAHLCTMAADGVVVLDAWKLLSAEGRLRDEYAADMLHLNARGYQVLNAELENLLRTLPKNGEPD